MSADLHEMHALLQQLQDLNESHDLDHCEGPMWDRIKGGAASVANGAAALGKSANAYRKGGSEGLARHTLNVADQKKRDTDVLAKWGDMKDPEKKQALKRVVDMDEANVLGPVLLGNEATKYMTQEGILPFPAVQK